jgi:hypothetical protein
VTSVEPTHSRSAWRTYRRGHFRSSSAWLVLRQGNQNPRVEILNYVTEQTWDTVMWQTVERKARFIGQIETGDLDARTAEDLGSDELGNSAAATKAVATGDPRYLAQVQLDDDVKRLSALRRAHGDAKARNATERRVCGREITATGDQLAQLDTALPRIAASVDAPFAMSVGGRAYSERGRRPPRWWTPCARRTATASVGVRRKSSRWRRCAGWKSARPDC